MTEEKEKRIKELLFKLKKAHLVYVNCKEDQKVRLFNSCGFILDELERLGAARAFCETLLMSGKEFLVREYSRKDLVEEEVIFGAPLQEVGYLEGIRIKEAEEKREGEKRKSDPFGVLAKFKPKLLSELGKK